MPFLMLIIAALSCRVTIESGAIPLGSIRNVSLKIPQGNTTTIHGTCQSCLCALVADSSLFALNCFSSNLTCEMHSKADQSKPFSLVNFAMSTFYFSSFPTYFQGGLATGSTMKYSTMSGGKQSVTVLSRFEFGIASWPDFQPVPFEIPAFCLNL